MAGLSVSAVTVAFMDIKSACKALQTAHKLDERLLKTDFYDPTSGACGSGSCPPTPEEKGGGPGGGPQQPPLQGPGKLDHNRSSQHSGPGHYYRGHGDREYGGRGPTHTQHPPPRYPEDFRHRSRPPYRSSGPFNQESVRGTSSSYRSSYGWKDSRARPEQTNYNSGDKSDQPRIVNSGKPVNGGVGVGSSGGLSITPHKKKHRTRKSRSSESGSDSQQSGSNSRSSSSSSSRSSSSGSGSSKSPSPDRSRLGKGVGLGNYLPHTEFDKLCTIVVRNLPERPTENAVKDELSREYKKGGCVVRAVRIVEKRVPGQAGRTAIITFSDPADVSKALEDSRNKRIFGSLIDVEKLNTHADDRPRDGELSEFHAKATRTLFVGNISREVLPSEIHERFKEFGEILEIDIKKPDYALVQFVDIRSVVKAIRAVDGELIAGLRVRLQFGLSVATKCVWCDGVGGDVTEKMLQLEFSQYGKIQDLIIDRSRGHALVYFDQLKKATIAVSEMRGRSVLGSRLQTDYASHECRAAFFEHCKKSGMDIRERAKPWEQEPDSADKRGERMQRDKSNESRGSGTSRVGGRKRDEYDEELRRFQNERGKIDNETERCFTPPYVGSRRGVAVGGPSRSPSPPRGVSGPSPGQQSRSGIERTFSDRESVVSDGSRHGSPVSRDSWRGSRYKPRTQAISPPGDSRSPGDPDTDSRRGSKRYRPLDNGDSGDYRLSRGRISGPSLGPQDPRIEPEQAEKKGQFKLLGVDSGLSEDTSSGSSGSVPDVDNAKLLGRSTTARRSSTDSAVSRDESSRPPTPSHAPIPVYTSSSSLLRVVPSVTDCEGGLPYGAPRTPVSPPPSSDGSRPGTPLCDENPENLMSRSAAAPVRLASHLRQQNSSEPMSLPLPRFAQHVLSTSPGERSQRSLQISPREPRPDMMAVQAPAQTTNSLKQSRPELSKLSIMSPTKFGPGSADLRARDPRLKSPSLKSPGLQPPLKSPVTVPGGSKSTFLSPEASPASSLTVKVGNLASDCKPKDPRLVTGLLTVAVPSVTTASPASPSPRHSRPRTPPQPPEPEQPLPQPVHHPVQPVIPTEKDPKASDPSDSLTERLKLLDEKYEAWSGLIRPGSGSNRQDQSSRFNLDMKPAQPSAIVQKLLARKSVFDEDTKRLEKKYEPPEEEKGESGSGIPGTPGMGSGYATISTLSHNPVPVTVASYIADSPRMSGDSPVLSMTDSNFQTSLPREIPTMPLNSVSPIRSAAAAKLPAQLPLRQPNMSPNPTRLYFSPQIQSPKALDDSSSRPLPLPSKVGTPATSGTIPIKPLVDKLSKPAAFTKPSATVTPTLKSTGLTASTVRPIVFTTTSTKTVSTCTMAPSTHPHPLHTSVEKGEASSTTCSPKPDSALSEVSSTTALVPPQETDSDPNVTSTTGIESKKKLDINRDIKTIKKEFDSLTSFKEKKDLVEESLFTPTATIIQAVKPKYDKKDKRTSSSSRLDIFNTIKDVKRAKDNLHKEKIKSNKEKKDKMKVKQKEDLKDFLQATATIRKEAKKEQEKKPDATKDDKSDNKRRLSINSEVDDSEPKTKIPKLNDFETEIKKVKTDAMKPMGRIPKLEKKEEKRERTDSVKSLDGIKEKHKSLSKSDSRSKSKHDDRHRHRSSEKHEERNREKHKKKKKEKDKDKEKEDKSKKIESKSRSHSTDEDKHHKKMKKSKDFKKRDEKKSKSERKEKNRDKERERDKEKHRDKDRERERKRKKEEEERKKLEHARKKQRKDDSSNSENSDDSSDDEDQKFSIFDEPVFDENNPIYFSMYDKVKARRSCVKAREEEEARKQEEALNKFAKLKAQRAKREEKKKSVDSEDESMSEDEENHLMDLARQNDSDESDNRSEDMTVKKKTASQIRSSSDSDIGFKSNKSKKKKKSRSGASSGEERKRSFKPKRAVVDSSDDSSQTESRKPSGILRPTPNIGLDSSESDENLNKSDAGQTTLLTKSKLNIYTDSDSEQENRVKSSKTIKSESDNSESDRKSSAMAMLAKNKAKSAVSDSESEPTEPKSSALAVLAKSKKKSPKEKTEVTRPVVKSEPITSDSEQDVKNSNVELIEAKKEVKKEIKAEKDNCVKDVKQPSVDEKLSKRDKDSRQLSIEERACKKEKDGRLGLVEEKSLKKDKDFRQTLADEKSSKKDKKKHLMKKEKRRDKEPKENFKEKSLLGQKLKMAKIFGTSSEDESTTRNSKPPTPNTSASKQSSMVQIPVKGAKLNVDQVFSDSEPEKQLESPALESDSDDGLPSRPPTPSFPTTKTEELKVASPPKIVKLDPVPIISDQVQEVKPKTKQEEIKTKARTENRENSRDLFNDSTDEEVSTSESRPKNKKDRDRSRHTSAHERQKENENLFDSLLTVNVDLPTRTVPRKSPGGTALKSPGCLKSPSTKSPGKSSTPTVSPGSHRSPMISPGGKPTYLLAHMHDKAASREAEKIHRAQEREMQKRGSDKVSKESFKTKKDLTEASTKKSEDPSNKLSKTKEERKFNDVSENSIKAVDGGTHKQPVKSERKPEFHENSGKVLNQVKEKKMDTDDVLEAEAKCKEVNISQEKKSDINVSLKDSKLEMDSEQVNEKPEIKVKEKGKEGTNLDKNFKEESVSLCLSESDSDSNSVKDLDTRKPNEVTKISSTRVKENAKLEISKNHESGINKLAVSDGKSLTKSSKSKESKFKSDDAAAEYKKPKDKGVIKEGAPEHKKLSISDYHEARKSKELEMSRKVKESAKTNVQVDDSEKTTSVDPNKDENKIKDRGDAMDSGKMVKPHSSFGDSNSHKIKESAVDERRSKPTVDPAVKKEVQRSLATITTSTMKDNQDTRFKHLERSSKAEEDEKPILLKEPAKSTNGSELKDSDSKTRTSANFSKQDSIPEMKDGEILELAVEKPKEIYEDNDSKSLVNDLPPEVKATEVNDKEIVEEATKVSETGKTKALAREFKINQEPDSEESADDSLSLVIDLDNKAPVVKEKTSVFDFDDELEEKLEKPLKPALDSIKKPLADKEPLESSAGGDVLSSANKQAEPSETTLDQVQSDESSKTSSLSSPSYALFASGTEIEATSSPSPVSEYEEGSLIILADEQDKKTDDGNNDDTDVESSFSKPAAITRRKLSDYVPPEEQVILEKVTAVDPEKPYRTPEPSEQEQLEKSIASITGDIPADAAESDSSNYVQSAPEPELVVKRTVISQEETESAVNALLGESFESFEEPVEAAAPQPVDSLDDDPMGSCADDEAAAAVAGLATEMSPDNNEDWHNRMAMHQAKQADKEAVETAVANIPSADKQDENDESIENIAAEIRRSSIENEERRPSVESKDSDVEAVVDDMEEESPGRLGKAQAKESLTPRRGRSAVSSLQPSPASVRGRGRGGRVTRGQARTESESSGKEGGYESEKSEGEGTPRGRGKVSRNIRGGRGSRRIASLSQSDMDDRKSRDVFDFQESDEESVKTVERSKQSGSNVDTVIEEVVKGNYEESAAGSSPTIISVRQNPPRGQQAGARVRGGKAPVLPHLTQSPSTTLTQPSTITTTTSMIESVVTPAPAVSPVVQLPQSPTQPLRLSIEEKVSPSVSMTSPTSRSPKPRMRRSTGGKSRESEEESADTRQKINLILEQAKQEAERSAAAQHLPLVPMPGYRVADGGIPITALVSQASSPSQEVLIDPKTGHTVRLSAPSSVTLTLVTSTPSPLVQSEPRAAVITNTAPRAGIPQPTVLPPRHDQQVRPAPRVVPAPVRPPVVSGPRPALPIQLPTQPLPPESVRKAQPVLLEQNQPTKQLATVTTLPRTVSLPTEPVPRSVANQMPNLPRTPLPFSSAHMVTTRQVPMTVTSQQATLSRHVVTSTVTRPAPCPTIVRPQHAPVETGQRVSLGKRDGTKEFELEVKPRDQPYQPPESTHHQPPLSQAQVKVQRDYLQPRDREAHRPASTPNSSSQQQQQLKEDEKQQSHVYPVPRDAHIATSAQPYDAQSLERSAQTLELIRLANYRELTMIYQQLLAAGHPEHMAQSLAQSMVRDRFIQESVYNQAARPVHEEPRPGSVPPAMVHHLEEIRIQQARQPMPAHRGDPYRQSDSPLYGVPHPYTTTPPSAHVPDPYRRGSATGEQELVPPAAHSGQQLVRLTQSPAISDYSTSRPASPSPAYTPNSDYRLPHLAAYPICWSGTLGLKNDMANVRMHYVSGNRDLARASLPSAGATLKIVQRMRLEDSQLDGVARKMETKSEHCMLLALPNGSEHEEIEHQSRILRSNFITYLQLKSAAGIVNVSNEDNQPAYIVHVFPSCDFANENLARIAPNLLHRVADIEHLVIVIATVFDVNR